MHNTKAYIRAFRQYWKELVAVIVTWTLMAWLFTPIAKSSNIVQPGVTAWGAITGTLSNQTDLNTALGLKAPLAGPLFTGLSGFGQPTPAATVDILAPSTVVAENITGTQPASVGSGNGTSATDVLDAVAPAGGSTTDAASTLHTGGTGGGFTLTTGNGGDNASTSSSGSSVNRGGNSGTFTINGGTGGSATASSGTTKGGNAGAINMLAGSGGASAHGFAGAGGAVTINSGQGGSNNTAGGGGAGGNFAFTGGSGGSGTTTAGSGGSIAIAAGTGGAAASGSGGNGGFGGLLSIDAGVGGSADGAGTPGTAGAITIGGTSGASVALGRAGIVTKINGTLASGTNCSSNASPAVCAASYTGAVAIPTGVNSTLVVNTTAVTANSRIFLLSDDSLTTGATCNSTLATLVGGIAVTARSAGTSFTISFSGTITTNPVCVSFLILN